MEGLDIQTIIQGGGMGIGVLMIIYSAWKDKIYNKTLNNHLEHVNASNEELGKQMALLNQTHQRTNDLIEKSHEVFGEVKGVINNCKRK